MYPSYRATATPLCCVFFEVSEQVGVIDCNDCFHIDHFFNILNLIL